ncbi:MAG: hypothetical protein ACHREM_02660, partial [Polyangiales bacterium]
VCAALGVACIVGAIVAYVVDEYETLPIILSGVGAGVFLLIGLIIALVARRLRAREKRVTPEVSVRGYLGALTLLRGDRACAAIAPPVRGQLAVTPTLDPVVTVPGSFIVHPDSMKLFAKSFAAQGNKHVRTLTVRKATIVAGHDRIAEVEAELVVTSFPQWANLTVVILFVAIRLVGLIVGVILMAIFRKSWKGKVRFRCVRSVDGVWYLAEPWGDQLAM